MFRKVFLASTRQGLACRQARRRAQRVFVNCDDFDSIISSVSGRSEPKLASVFVEVTRAALDLFSKPIVNYIPPSSTSVSNYYDAHSHTHPFYYTRNDSAGHRRQRVRGHARQRSCWFSSEAGLSHERNLQRGICCHFSKW